MTKRMTSETNPLKGAETCMNEIDIEDIVENWLFVHGYDGLVNVDTECGCTLYNFRPCGGCICNCHPAYDHGAKNGVDYWMMLDPPAEHEDKI